MRFNPRLPRDGINISHEHPLKEAAVLVAGLSLVFALIFVTMLWFVDIVVALIPPRAEARVVERWNLSALDFEADTVEARQTQALVDRLAVHWPDAPYTFRIGIMPGKQPNAFALPGGLIVVTQGLLTNIESENELALVLGHELGHFRHRDHLRRLGRGMVLSLGISVLAPTARTSISLSEMVGSLTARGFGREDERRSDRFGLELVHAEYGHVASAWDFFDSLDGDGDGDDGDLARVAAYLSTHPADVDRIDRLKALALERGWPTTGVTTPFTLAE